MDAKLGFFEKKEEIEKTINHINNIIDNELYGNLSDNPCYNILFNTIEELEELKNKYNY